MNELSQIKESIRKIAGQNRSQLVFTAKVESVDGEKCSVSIDGLTISDVRLRSVINGENSKILITPEQGSYVLVIDLSGGDFSNLAVIGYSQIEKIDVDANDKIIFNGGSNHGLVNIEELTQKLNAIEKDINTLKSVFSAWTPVAQDGGAALKSDALTWASQQLQITQQSDYEDTNITH